MKKNVVSIPESASIREAAQRMAEKRIGTLPVVDSQGMVVGMIGLQQLLTLELPDFFNLIPDLDFLQDFGAVESTRPTPEQIDQPITTLMQPATLVVEDCGLLRAFGIMIKHNLADLIVVSDEGKLRGIASRVDIGSEILANWQTIGIVE
jgi:CBS domain-containing protein